MLCFLDIARIFGKRKDYTGPLPDLVKFEHVSLGQKYLAIFINFLGNRCFIDRVDIYSDAKWQKLGTSHNGATFVKISFNSDPSNLCVSASCYGNWWTDPSRDQITPDAHERCSDTDFRKDSDTKDTTKTIIIRQIDSRGERINAVFPRYSY